MQWMQQDYLDREDVCIVPEKIGRFQPVIVQHQSRSRSVLDGIYTGGYWLEEGVTPFLLQKSSSLAGCVNP
jgi:hypothetical protein